MLLLGNIPWTMATPKVDLNDLDNQEIPQKRLLQGYKTMSNILINGKKLGSFVDLSTIAYQDKNIAVNAYGTSPEKLIYGTLFDKRELISKLVTHLIHPADNLGRLGGNRKCWVKDQTLVDVNGGSLVKQQASIKDYRMEYQQHLPGFMLNTQYYAKGHEAPCADFLTADEQKLTFLFTNAAPMSQSLNNGKWKGFENLLRLYSDALQRELIIITLCSGQMMDDSTFPPQPLKLNNRITVPERFAKVVIDPYLKESAMVYTSKNELQHKDLYDLYVEYDLTSAKIKMMFPELNYLDFYDCNPSGKPYQMIEAVKQIAPTQNIFSKPKN